MSHEPNIFTAFAAAVSSVADDIRRAIEATFDQVTGVMRATSADLAGKHDLADVIRTRPGRQIVRDGLADVRHWTHDCACYHRDPLERGWCVPTWERVDTAVLALATSSPLSARALRQLVIDFLELPVVDHLAQHEDVVDVALAWLRATEALSTVSGVRA